MSDYLIHYASKYYDPVKAHEYYMEHRKLVARRKTSDLDEVGQEAASYVKKQLDEERDKEIQTVQTELQTNLSNIQAQIEDLKTASQEEREQKRAEINKQIEKAKKEAAERKNELMRQLGIRIADRNAETQKQIARDTEADKRRKDTLRAQMKSLGKGNSDRKEQLQNLINEITDNRTEENANARAELSKENSADRIDTSEQKQTVSDELRATTKEVKGALKEFIVNSAATLKQGVSDLKDQMSQMKQETKDKVAEIKSKYEEAYLSELDQLHAEHTAVKSSGKSSRSGSSSSSKASSNSSSSSSSTKSSTKKTTKKEHKGFSNGDSGSNDTGKSKRYREGFYVKR